MLREVLLVLMCAAPMSAVAQDLSGVWRGYWTRNGDTMAVTMVVRRDTGTAPYAATFSSERLRVTGIPFANVRLDNGRDVILTLRGDRTTTEFAGKLRHDSLIGVFHDGPAEGRFAFRRAVAARPIVVEREITFSNGGVTLAGSLLLPRAGNAVSAVVFLHGSGSEGRWASR